MKTKLYNLKQLTQKVFFKTGIQEVFGLGEETVRDLLEKLNKEQARTNLFIIKQI